jgi:glycosyltransferase involved in cell wall biosynthesis
MGLADCPDCEKGPFSGLLPHCEAIEDNEGGKTWPGLKNRLKWFDMVLGYDSVSVEALAPYVSEHSYLGALQGGYESRLWRPVQRDWFSPRFQFIMHGAINARKAPWVAIQAFNELKFDKPGPYPAGFDDARLAIHTNNPGDIFPEMNDIFGDKGIRIWVESFSKEELDKFYAAGHCLLAPSRGEGKNLPALEFMTTGGVVAATAFGGHQVWMGGDWAYPLEYELTPTFENCPWGARDAKVSIEHMKDVLWHIYTHRAEAKHKAELAQQLIPKMCDWQVVIENLFRRIRDNVELVGPEIYDQAMSCRREPEGEGFMAPGMAGVLRP